MHRLPLAPRRSPLAFTLIEMLTAVALLVIVLGLMVSLARYVRSHSATQLTRDLLSQLEEAKAHYVTDNKAGQAKLARVQVLCDTEDLPDEKTLLRLAEVNNRQFVGALRDELTGKFWWELPGTIYDRQMLRDAWGTPIVLMPKKHSAIGMAPGDAPFFLSAGPDRQFRTREDNLYSYERGGK